MGFEAKARSRLVIFGVSLALLLLCGAVLQTSIFGKLTYVGAVPDLMLCIVTCVAFFNGRHQGAITGLAAGALIEAIASSGIVLLPLFYMIFGYTAGHYARAVQPKRFIPYLFYLTFALLLRAGITVLYACLTYQNIHLLQILVHAVFPEMLATVVAGVCLYFPLMLFCRKVKA
jgi:rod shape-determining protein MreD